MKKYIERCFFLLGICMTLVACEEENPNIRIEDGRSDSYALSFSMSVLDAQTRATEEGDHYDPLNENVVNNMYAFLYNDAGAQVGYYATEDGNLVVTKDATTAVNPLSGGTGDAVRGTATIYIPKEPTNPFDGQNLHLYAVVNYHGTESLLNKTLDELKAVTISSASLDQTTVEKQTDFLMDGTLETGILTWASSNTYNITTQTGNYLKLARAAAKIRLRIKDIIVSDGNVGFDMVGKPTVALIRGVKNTSLLAGNPVATKEWVSTDYQEMNQHEYDGETFYARDIPFYSYENDWTTDGDIRTNLVVRLMLRKTGTTDTPSDFYFNVPVNYLLEKEDMTDEEKAGITKLQRNHLYDIVCNIKELGKPEPGKPTELNGYIAIEDWNSPDAVDGSITKAHYLVVKELTPIMPNTGQRDIQYISDLDLDLTASVLDIETEYTSYDYVGEAHTNIGHNEDGRISITTIEKSGLRYIRVTSPVPNNYVPLTIRFRAQHVAVEGETGTPLFEDVTVTQYPPIYVTAEKSTGSQIYWYFPFTAYNANGLTATGGHQAGYQRNNTLFKVTTLVPQAGQIIGDPTLGTDRTGRTEEANNITSPEFIIASQWGMSVDVPQYSGSGNLGWQANRYNLQAITGIVDRYRYNGTFSRRYYDYYNADTRAYNYWEDKYGPAITRTIEGDYNGNRNRTISYTFNPQYEGRWRIPTLAELALIVQIQSDGNSAVKNLLWGDAYWSAQTNYHYNFRTKKAEYHIGTQSIRPVFDTYNK